MKLCKILKLQVIFLVVILSGCSTVANTIEPFAQWVAFSDKSYKKNIESICFIATESQRKSLKNKYSGYVSDYGFEDQVIETLKDNLKTYNELADIEKNENIYLILLLKNIGEKYAWGTVKCKFYKGYQNFHFKLGWNGWNSYIAQIHRKNLVAQPGSWLAPKSDSIPEIKLTWEKLYRK